MTKNFEGRIQALKARRQTSVNTKRLEKSLSNRSITLDSLRESYAPFEREEYEDRSSSPALKYALGAMQEVAPRYTEISHEEAKRITDQLVGGLSRGGQRVETALQGSLPLNVHLRRVSDVDLLVLPDDFFVYSQGGALAGTYVVSSRNRNQVVLDLRSRSVSVLAEAFPAATVDDSGSKCITISGGSLRRDVDVVPAIWFNTYEYQQTQTTSDRAVDVYDKHQQVFSTNYPFKVQKNVNLKDSRTGGGCKKAIRLLKTLKADAEQDIDFSSFNIMSIVCAMGENSISYPKYYEGMMLLSIRDFMRSLGSNREQLRALDAVDGSRKIIRGTTDETAFDRLTAELDDLVESVAEELNPFAVVDKEKALRTFI